MRLKRTILVSLAALALLGVGGVGAQVVRGHHVIQSPPGDFSARWVKIDKSPANPSYQIVYCVAYEQGVSCDWDNVRQVHVYNISG